MKQTVFLMMILRAVISGCSDQGVLNQDLDQPKVNVTKAGPPAQLAWKMASLTWPDLCTKVKFEVQDSRGATTLASDDTTILLASTSPIFYSDSLCSNPILAASVVLLQNSSLTVIYLKSSTVGLARLDIAAPGLASASLTFNTVTPVSDLVLGQMNFTSSVANHGGISAAAMSSSFSATTDGHKVFVADQANSRILIWNSKNPGSGLNADLVLGQPDFSSSVSNNGGVSASSLGSVESVSSDGKRLFAVDMANHRILIWKSIPTSNFQAADVVIGQPNMVSNQINNGGLGPSTLSSPKSVFSDGKKLVVSDAGNNRVLIWNTIPKSNFQPADVVIGQVDMNSRTVGFKSFELNNPNFASIQEGHLTVSDSSNHRILLWNIVPTSDGTSADLVIGQTNITSRLAHAAHVGADGLTNPGGVRIDSQGRVYVLDSGSNRLLIWNQIPTSSGAPADLVIGQSDFLSNLSGTSSANFDHPWGLDIHDNELWIGDQGNNRVLRMTIPF